MSDFLYEMWVYQYPKCVLVMLVAWFCYLKTEIEVIVDFVWCLNHWIIGASLVLQYTQYQDYSAWVLLAVLTLWFVRLGGFLFFTRVMTGHKDKRYVAIALRAPEKKALLFFVQYQLQAFLVIWTASTLYWVFRGYQKLETTGIRWNFVVGVVISLFGIVMEMIADNQLENYKKMKAEQRQTKKVDGQKKQGSGQELVDSKIEEKNDTDQFSNMLHSGLWKKSRHPNLFYELVTWFGFAVSGLNDYNISFMAFLGPLTLWAIMYYLTIPLTERTMRKTRPNWNEWCARTNKLLPFF